MSTTLESNELPALALAQTAERLEELALAVHTWRNAPQEVLDNRIRLVTLPADVVDDLLVAIDQNAEVLRNVSVSLRERSEIADVLRGSFMARVAAHVLRLRRPKDTADA